MWIYVNSSELWWLMRIDVNLFKSMMIFFNVCLWYEFMWIYVTRYESTYGFCGCPAEWYCAAVRAAVYGGAHGSVRQCAWWCMAVRAAVCGCPAVRQCAAVRAAVCGSARGSVWQCAWQCVAVRSTYYYTQSRPQCIYWYALIEAVGVSPILLTY